MEETQFLIYVAERTTPSGGGGYLRKHPDSVPASSIAEMDEGDFIDYTSALNTIETYRSLPKSAKARPLPVS